MVAHITRASSEWRELAASHLLECGVVDAHHHMIGRAQRRALDPGLMDWLEESYLFCFGRPGTAFARREWRMPEDIMPFLRLMRATTYYRIVRLGLLNAFSFDIDGLDESNWDTLDGLIREANRRDDWFDEILGKRVNVRCGVLDKFVGGMHVDATGRDGSLDWYEYILGIRPGLSDSVVAGKTKIRELDGQMSKCSLKIDCLLYGYLKCMRGELKQLFGGEPESVRDLSEYLEYVDGVFERIAADDRNVALKSAIACVRLLDFPETSRTKAERVFAVEPGDLEPREAADFESFMMHYVCERAAEHGLPIQFHATAAFGASNVSRDFTVMSMIPLIAAHPDTEFDLMHGGYPHYGECGYLAGRFPNVHLNLAWMTLMSDAEARRVLDDWLDYVPASKIMWGGDCLHVEETLGAYLVSREQVIDVLGNRIDKGQIGREDAIFYLERIFRDNATELFGL